MKINNKAIFFIATLLFATFAFADPIEVEHERSDQVEVNSRNVANAIGAWGNMTSEVGDEVDVEFSDGSTEKYKKTNGSGSFQWFPIPATFEENNCGVSCTGPGDEMPY